ncbi:hypothetical protein PMZ80_007099 [Knufia obscura]|uniref:FAS1 domain-containing protein n=2 Tax=Knufia TaxID=430999 RepID=A0AAN8EJW5_9EURO|nr:hypothetical protein PMZ80_007099 [Knufia obscura]KAK5953108.1 hypothetical protein OHC33_005676 [Knufia fluminis]
MRIPYISILAASLATAGVSAAFSIPRFPFVDPSSNKHNQRVMTTNDLGPQIPMPPKKPSDQNAGGNGDLTISDILPSQRQINIFAGLTRDISSLTSRLESQLPSSNTTLLAPLNSAMSNLPRKPWEDRPGDTSGVSAESSEDKAAKNLRRFVLEHVVPVSPWEEGQKIRTLWSQENEEGKEGREIWWERRGGGDSGETERKVIMPGKVVVAGVVGRVGNGEVWSLKDVVNYE